MEVTAIKIWLGGWRRGGQHGLSNRPLVELEESKEAIRGEDSLIIRTLFNKLSPVIKRSACSSLWKAGSRKIRTIRIAYNAEGPEFSIRRCM